MVFRSWTLRKNIWWGEVTSEKVAYYHYARKQLGSLGWQFTAAVVDGRRGLANVFKDIPVQVCQFHQLQTVTKYLTRRPKTAAGKELRLLALTLTKTNEVGFTKALSGRTSCMKRLWCLVYINPVTHTRMYVLHSDLLRPIYLICLRINGILSFVSPILPIRLMGTSHQ